MEPGTDVQLEDGTWWRVMFRYSNGGGWIRPLRGSRVDEREERRRNFDDGEPVARTRAREGEEDKTGGCFDPHRDTPENVGLFRKGP